MDEGDAVNTEHLPAPQEAGEDDNDTQQLENVEEVDAAADPDAQSPEGRQYGADGDEDIGDHPVRQDAAPPEGPGAVDGPDELVGLFPGEILVEDGNGKNEADDAGNKWYYGDIHNNSLLFYPIR